VRDGNVEYACISKRGKAFKLYFGITKSRDDLFSVVFRPPELSLKNITALRRITTTGAWTKPL
jgi:hypothetical protein